MSRRGDQTDAPLDAGPGKVAYHPLVREVARALGRRCRVDPGAGVLVAVSGGADSVALLRALHVLGPRRRWGLRLVVGHVHHHLRGEAADADAALVADLAGHLGLDHERADLAPGPARGNREAAARRARYAALVEIADRRGCRFIATAHHGDDQLETQLLRLIRGSAARGLSGIAWRRRARPGSDARLVRPMLGVDHALARAYLDALGQSWREDHTNADPSRSRARLRRDVLPVLRDLSPAAARKALAAADHCRDAARVVDRQVARARRRWVHAEARGTWIDRAGARGLDRAVLGELVRQTLVGCGVPGDRVSRSAVLTLARAVRDREGGERRFPFAGGVEATLTRDRLVVTRRGPSG